MNMDGFRGTGRWKKTWVRCESPQHKYGAYRYDHPDGTQEGWECQHCGYSVCKYCTAPRPAPCPRCGR